MPQKGLILLHDEKGGPAGSSKVNFQVSGVDAYYQIVKKAGARITSPLQESELTACETLRFRTPVETIFILENPTSNDIRFERGNLFAHSPQKRIGQKYYLHVGETKTGKPTYYFSMDAGGPLGERVPRDFEIYENPNGQVFLRKILPKLISDDELAVVERELGRISRLKGCRVERKLRALTVYVADRKEDLIKELGRVLPWGRLAHMDHAPEDLWSYYAELQFMLVDEKKRLFQTRRYCYRGRIDDWIDIGERGPLATLARQYIKHLDQESYFELF